MQLRFPQKLTLTRDNLVDLSFILYFCSPVVAAVLSFVLRPLGLSSFTTSLKLIIIYLPLLLAVIIAPKKFGIDFLALLSVLIGFFMVSYLIHPEYAEWYRLSYYGAWDYVFRLDNGIYAYLFIRIVRDPERALKNLHTASWVLLPYYAYRLIGALRVGYWVENISGEHTAYNLTFGYSVVLLSLVFLYYAITSHKVIDWICVGITILMIILGGSRGPFLCLGFFVLIRVFTRKKKLTKSGILLTILLTSIAVLIFIYYQAIVTLLLKALERTGHSSRTLRMLLQGSIANDTGRQRIWMTALQMIRDNPWGHGAMGSRLVIRNIISVGHPHQLFLELLIDFGVFIGGAMILCMLIASYRIIFHPKDEKWRWLYVIFFCRACQLLFSGTFWHVAAIWACLGIGISYAQSVKRASSSRRLNA